MANKERADKAAEVEVDCGSGKTWMELLTGWKSIRTPWRKNHLDESFLRGIDSILVQLKSDETVLIGDVDNGNKLPKSFPWMVQYVFRGCEYIVHKLWLVAGEKRTIFILTGNSQDLAMIFATHHAIHFGQSGSGPRGGGDGSGDGSMSPDPATETATADTEESE